MSHARTFARVLSVAVLTTMLFSTLGSGVAEAVSRREQRLYNWINKERIERDKRRLRLSDRLSRMARNHSREMAEGRRVVYHSCLSCKLRSYSYRIAGENVGAASRLRAVHRAFMRSRPHRRNILRSGYRRVGVGVVKAHGKLWVTEIFLG